MRSAQTTILVGIALFGVACAAPRAPRTSQPASGATATQSAPAAAPGGQPPAASSGEAAAASPARPLTKVIACIPSRSDNALALYAAQEAGLLKQYNVEAEIPHFAGGAVDVAFTAGQCDFIMGAGGIGPLLQGVDVTVVAVVSANMPGQIWGRPPLRTLADLKGKALGTTGPGSLSWRVGRYYLTANGLAPEEDVAVLALGDTASTYGAVVVGRVDAALLFPPQTFIAPKDGLNLIYAAPPTMEMMNNGLVTSKRYLAANRDVVRDMIRGVTQVMERLKADEAFYAEHMRAFTNSPELTSEALREYWQASGPLYNVPPRGSLAGATLALSLYAERPPDAALEATAREWLDMSLVDELWPAGAGR